jgi:hypothetical protein
MCGRSGEEELGVHNGVGGCIVAETRRPRCRMTDFSRGNEGGDGG